jgi:hypothetical protein
MEFWRGFTLLLSIFGVPFHIFSDEETNDSAGYGADGKNGIVHSRTEISYGKTEYSHQNGPDRSSLCSLAGGNGGWLMVLMVSGTFAALWHG